MVEPKYSVYEYKDITFITSQEKIIVQTQISEYFLDPEEWYNKDDLIFIVYLIQKGKICSMKTLRDNIVGKFYLESTKKRHEVMSI